MIISKTLKEIRENAGLSQEQFAEKLAVSRQAVSKWERGVAMPDIENIMYISDLFNVSLDTIVKGDKEMEKKIISDNKRIKLVNRLFIGILVTVITVIGFITWSFGKIIPFIFDPIAVIIMVFFPLLFQFAMYGKFFPKAFSVILNRKNDEEMWKKAKGFFNNYMMVLWLTAILFLSIDFILVLKYLDNREGLGSHLFFMGNLIITAGLINLAIVIPYKVKIQQHFIQTE